jgi:large subunit ribosomal protein L24
MAARLKKGDTVVVISGKDSGKKGKIINFLKGRVIVEKMNIAKKSQKPSKNFQGGIIEKPMPMDPSKVMLVCAKCNDGVRVKFEKVEDKTYRKCVSCGDLLDKVK